MDSLAEQFTEYQLLEDSDIPEEVWRKATAYVDGDDKFYYRMDVIWHYLSTMQNPDSSYRFRHLFLVAKLILVIPHSNAEEERVFSLIQKNKTAFHPNLDPKVHSQALLQ